MNSVVRTGVISAEPIDLASMKNWLKVNQTSDDQEITDLISEAREHCELLTNCALVRSTFVQYLDHFPGHHGRNLHSFGTHEGGWNGMGYDRHHRHYGEIKLKRPPLVSVQSIWYIGTDGRPYTLNPGQDFIVDIASRPGRIRPIPYTVWPLTLHVPAAVAIRYTAGYSPNDSGLLAGQTGLREPENITQGLPQTWQPSTSYLQYAFQVDENGNIWIQTTNPSGVTGSTRPNFENPATQNPGSTIAADGTANWLNVGPLRGFWTPGTVYAGQQTYVVLDFNSNLQLLNVASLISQTIPAHSLQTVGVSPLPWATTLGAFTADNKVASAWRCLGPYNTLGNTGLALPNSPEQQAAVTVDYTLPRVVTRAIKVLVHHWYFNRQPVVLTAGAGGKHEPLPFHLLDMLGQVTVYDYSPTP